MHAKYLKWITFNDEYLGTIEIIMSRQIRLIDVMVRYDRLSQLLIKNNVTFTVHYLFFPRKNVNNDNPGK